MHSASSVNGPWAVYQTTLRGKQTVMHVVCEQREWDVMEKAQPGSFPLVRGWISSEAEAERLALLPPADRREIEADADRMARAQHLAPDAELMA